MTTIIIDPNTESIYSDSRGTYSETGCFAKSKKIHTLGQMYLSCATGDLGTYEIFRASFDIALAKLPSKIWPYRLKSCTIFVVSKDGGTIHVNTYVPICRLFYSEFKLVSSRILTEPLVAGSGSNFAKAALACGKTPEEAIKLTATLDIATDSNVVCEKIDELYDYE